MLCNKQCQIQILYHFKEFKGEFLRLFESMSTKRGYVYNVIMCACSQEAHFTERVPGMIYSKTTLFLTLKHTHSFSQ